MATQTITAVLLFPKVSSASIFIASTSLSLLTKFAIRFARSIRRTDPRKTDGNK